MKKEEAKRKLAEAQKYLELRLKTTNIEEKRRYKNEAWLKLEETREYYVRYGSYSAEGEKEADLWFKFLPEIIEKYDASYPLENYFNRAWSRRRSSVYAEEKALDEKGITLISFDKRAGGDDCQGDEEGLDLYNVVEDKNNGITNFERALDMQWLMLEIALLLVDNSRNKWFKLLFTEYMTRAIKGVTKEMIWNIKHEQQIFKQIKEDFLDCFMSAVCRNCISVWRTPLKTNGEFGIKYPERELDLPLNTEVWIKYILNSNEMNYTSRESIEAKLSNNRKAFAKMMKEKRDQ